MTPRRWFAAALAAALGALAWRTWGLDDRPMWLDDYDRAYRR